MTRDSSGSAFSTPRAAKVAYSSVVGQGVIFTDPSGPVVATLGIRVPSPQYDYRSTAEAVADRIVASWNGFDRYGLALMMIAEGAGNPREIARKALAALKEGEAP